MCFVGQALCRLLAGQVSVASGDNNSKGAPECAERDIALFVEARAETANRIQKGV
jgi:hypothetical protein